ncbi:cell wall hydrolase [Jiella sp. CQZ9-1]|uniref:Cell wall hydrolase n=2 Tax=Jiella flava TaxID=2816857 RepID=A0A939FX32_9HYPH|nr:cell wall hydrolase [Jiella flava]
MKHAVTYRQLGLLTVLVLPLAGCVGAPGADEAFKAVDVAAAENLGPAQECLARAMYFESNRTSEDGMLAVGTVVMNRVASPNYPNDVCSVVGQPSQFAPGVMTRQMEAGKDLAMQTAYKVLKGARHKGVADAKYFHTAGMNFAYRNMNYMAIAGGNAFYEKVSRRLNPGLRMTTQAEVRAADDAPDAISAMRMAETHPTAARPATTTAMAYGEAQTEIAAATPVPSDRPSETAAPRIPAKSPFLGMFRSRQTATAAVDGGRSGRVLVSDESADRASGSASLASTSLPDVSASAGLAATSAEKIPTDEDWLKRW